MRDTASETLALPFEETASFSPTFDFKIFDSSSSSIRAAMHLFLDTNILLDIIKARPEFVENRTEEGL
jgi:hypothetical protein